MSPVTKKAAAKVTKPRTPRVKKVIAPLEPSVARDVSLPVATETEAAPKPTRAYLFAVGRRKTASASVRLIKNGSGIIVVNGKPSADYFKVKEYIDTVVLPLTNCGQANRLDVDARVIGGGMRGQADAVRLGISRALTLLNPTFRVNLRKAGFLTRDPRAKERKKYGLKKARRAPQWKKR